MKNKDLWERYKKNLCECQSLGMTLDFSRMDLDDVFIDRLRPEMELAYQSMDALEAGAIANPDEGRMVGHYWLRLPELAPQLEIRKEIENTIREIKEFAASVHAGTISTRANAGFTRLLIIGIGGSALGPQFIADALGTPGDRLRPFFLDNTDPDGINRVLTEIGKDLAKTLILVISKSGGTIETRNGMLETASAYKKAGLTFENHAVAITGVGSMLDKIAISGGWIARFPMWDWVGGRTSVFSAVGLLPAALQGINIGEFIDGAAAMDRLTRNKRTQENPAALLALSWHLATEGRGRKDMVILPYKDRLMLFPKYLQQLIMESLGKEKDLNGNRVHQGISVFGNKGTTDQHAYIQQLRDGVHNFFATFIEVLRDQEGRSLEVDPGITSGDYLSAYFLGTRNALYENNRASLTITIDAISARTIGALIALYERAVGLYATLIHVNAYHQPGVEAGKKMAGTIIQLQREVVAFLRAHADTSFTAEEIAQSLQSEDNVESIFKILEHASANHDHAIAAIPGRTLFDKKYRAG